MEKGIAVRGRCASCVLLRGVRAGVSVRLMLEGKSGRRRRAQDVSGMVVVEMMSCGGFWFRLSWVSLLVCRPV